MKSLILISSVIYTVLMFEQNDYNITFERTELVSYNHQHVADVKVVTFKYNRTQPAVNASFTTKDNIGHDFWAIVQGYTFLSNEYRIFPLRFQFNVCDAIVKNDFGLKTTLTQGNFTGCPLRKGSYYFSKWIPDSSKFPPFIPNGRYMIELQLLNVTVELVTVNCYGTVSRPFGRRH